MRLLFAFLLQENNSQTWIQHTLLGVLCKWLRPSGRVRSWQVIWGFRWELNVKQVLATMLFPSREVICSQTWTENWDSQKIFRFKKFWMSVGLGCLWQLRDRTFFYPSQSSSPPFVSLFCPTHGCVTDSRILWKSQRCTGRNLQANFQTLTVTFNIKKVQTEFFFETGT